MKAKKTFIENENDGMMNWSPNSASLIAVVNKDQKNKYGEYPGWRIAPGEFPYINSEVQTTLHNGRLTCCYSRLCFVLDCPELFGGQEGSQPRNTPSICHQAKGC
jgi:hypothetical protein